MEFSVKVVARRSNITPVSWSASSSLAVSPVRHGAQLDKACDGYLSALLRRGDLEGKADQMLLLHQVPGVLAERAAGRLWQGARAR